MNGKKIEIPINNKYIIKNKTPKNKEEYLSKPLNKKEFKSNKQITKKIDFCINEKKSPSKLNLFDDNNQYKNNIIKKTQKNKTKKRQNKFFKKKLKDREPSSLNSNLNIYKIVHSKDIKSSKLGQQLSSITTDSMNSYISNQSNKVNNNKCISLFNKSDNSKRKRIDSEISNNNNNKYLYIKKDHNEKYDITNINANTNRYKNNYNKNININNSNMKIKDSYQNIKINMLSPKSIRNINTKNPIKNNNSDLPNNEFKTDVKVKGMNNNMIINKSEFNLIFNKNNHNNKKNTNIKNYKKYSKEKNKNIFKDKINKEKEEKYYLSTNKNIFNENIKRYINNKNNDKDKYINNNKKLNINNNINKEIYSLNSNNYDNFKFNKLTGKENEKEIYRKKNLNPVKKSLFSEHMSFLINHQDENKINYNNNIYGINNNNYINIPFNSLLDSTDKIDYESKFINYDLGKTTGTSISKDSFFLFANKNNKKNEISKMINLSKNQNVDKNIEEKERTQEEMEKLAKEYLNISKYWENKDEYYKQNINQTNTITTVIDNNNYNDDTIFSDKNI